jgi:hypothetical protein
MPDHCHALVSFPDSEVPWIKVVRDWKHYLAHSLGIEWQTDFYDHRLRTDECVDQKVAYILESPVRADLVECPDAWPYIYHAEG